MADQWVTMRHQDAAPDSPTARTPLDAFNEVWAPKGWIEVDPVTVKATEILGKPVQKLTDLSKEELKSLASQSGVAVDETANKGDIAAAVTDALDPSTEADNG